MIVKKTKKDKTPRPKYNMAQNSWFMIKLAWTSGEKKVLVLCLMSVVLAVSSNLLNLFISPTVLEVVETHSSAADLLWTIAGFTIGIMLVSAGSAYVNTNTLYGRISVRSEIIKLVNRKAATTSYPNINDDKFTNLLAKASECAGSNRSATEAVWTTLTRLMTNLLGFSIYTSLLGNIQPMLILMILGMAVICYLIGQRTSRYAYLHREEEAKYEKRMFYLSDRSREAGMAKDIRIFGLKGWITQLYDEAMECYSAFHTKAQSCYIWAKIAELIMTFLRNAIAYAYLVGLVIREDLGVSEFLLFFTAVGGFAEWVTGILDEFHTLYRQSLDISTVRECLEYNEMFRFEGGSPIIPEAGKRYEIRIDHVSFRYPGAEQDILTDINLTLHPGEKLAVVGLNGAGKTTLIKLICGFLDPTQGRVLLDGKDIRDYNRADYYTMFAAVFQEFSLLAGTIAANIAQEEEKIDMVRVVDCAQKAGLQAKITSLANGYDTYLNRSVYEDAVVFSGGETQRLMLARALYKDAPFIILDEPTAALDPIAESEIYQKYHEMTQDKSSVYISHRLASTRFCDRIVLIEDAGIREEGTHEELLQRRGRYAELYEIQSKYYRKENAENEEK